MTTAVENSSLDSTGFKTEVSEFKGNKVITLYNNAGYRVISFGLKKAEAILATVDDIKGFIDAETKPTS